MRIRLTEIYKSLLQRRIPNSVLFYLFSIIDKLSKYRTELQKDLAKRAEHKLHEVLDLTKVNDGIFQGLRYEGITTYGSQLYPKILGSYEDIVQYQLKKIVGTKPDLVVDIGCAEGYYAVGLAKKLKMLGTKVIAIDIDPNALKECRKLALANDVSSSIDFRSVFDSYTLDKIRIARRPLIICDCEGCEESLFSADDIGSFLHCNLIIELHHFLKPNVENYLTELFSQSHNIEIIEEKEKKPSNYVKLDGLTYYQKRYALDEKRPMRMRWLVAKSLQTTAE